MSGRTLLWPAAAAVVAVAVAVQVVGTAAGSQRGTQAEQGQAQGAWLVKGSRFMKMERIINGLGIERERPGPGRRH